MNKVELEFIKRDVVIMQPNGKWFVMSKQNSLIFVEACKKETIKILGIDGFYLHENEGIEPSMANSIDFTSSSYKPSKDIYTEAITFLNQRDDILYFEIVCSD